MRKARVCGVAAAILHNALIRQTWLFCVWALWGLFYKKGLCKNSFGLFFFWYKRNGGGGWSVVFFCIERFGVALSHRKNEDGYVQLCIGLQKM